MAKIITAVVLDDQTVLLEGHRLAGTKEVADVLKPIVQSAPDVFLSIDGTPDQHYEGIGKIIYASQYAGMAIENLRFSWKSDEAK